MTTLEMLKKAKKAAPSLASASNETRSLALRLMAEELINETEKILDANKIDIKAAEGRISPVMTDRLRLDEKRIRGMADGILDVAALPDPLSKTISSSVRPNGLEIKKVPVPLGLIAIIYESRPNVTSDAAALCIKSGNACILRGGKEAFNSSFAITCALKKGLERAGLDSDLVFLVEDTTRASSYELMNAVGYVDALIPRGGAGLINACIENAKVPCIQTGTGICHIYVDKDADLSMAVSIVNNAKTSRPSVCNAAECCIVHREIASSFLPLLKEELVDKRIEKGLVPVELRLDEYAGGVISGTPAGECDFDTEFLDYILAVKTVGSTEEAVGHIALHSTHHSESIITENTTEAEKFLNLVDSAAVYWNASTRFTDGGEFGLGCEMGISTQKLHARGPMGLEELTSYKYIIKGNGQIR